MRRGQTATEYLIILAVVIVIALVVASILGSFPGIGSGTSGKVSDYKLSKGDKIGIDNYHFSNDSALAKIVNNNFETLIVNSLTIGGVVLDSGNSVIVGSSGSVFPLRLDPGQSATVNVSDPAFDPSQNDDTPVVIFTYTDPSTGANFTTSYGGGYGGGGSGGGISSSPNISLIPESYSLTVFEGSSGNYSILLNISNSGESGSTLNWENSSMTGDAGLVSLISLNTSSGGINYNESEIIEIIITEPGSLDNATYQANITFSDSVLTSVTIPFNITIIVIPVYTGYIKYSAYEHDLSIPWTRSPSGGGSSTFPSGPYDPYYHIQYVGSEYLDIGYDTVQDKWIFWIVGDQPTQGTFECTTFRASDGYPTFDFVSIGPEGYGNIDREFSIGPDVW